MDLKDYLWWETDIQQIAVCVSCQCHEKLTRKWEAVTEYQLGQKCYALLRPQTLTQIHHL